MKKDIVILFLLVILTACNDAFLDKLPQTTVSEKTFFQNVADLRTYSYQFYDYLEPSYRDRPSDNTTVEKGEIKNLLMGTVTADNYKSWNWEHLRSINYFLDNYKRAKGLESDINKYGAMGRFARAKFYINMIKIYSDVPWYSHVIAYDDVELLYKARDTRELVVDSIVADLEYATRNLTEEKSKTLLSKWVAFAELARFCLYEGTYRKYHGGETDFHVNKSPVYFLEKARNAADTLMQSGKFAIHTTGKPFEDYSDLFNGGTDLDVNAEIIMFLDYEDGKRCHSATQVLDYENGVSRDMADSYLYTSGEFVPKSVTDTTPLNAVFVNRDLRMKQSIFYPGYIFPRYATPYKLPISKTGGYGQIKFVPKDKARNFEGNNNASTDLPLYRYAEILLIYAEAQAEMGSLTQADLNKTVNLIRDRVRVGHMTMSPPVDPDWVARNPGISSNQKSELLEIRRERRVELFGEGFRYDDMMRWKLGKIFEKPQQGIYVPPSGLVDITGDGIPDYFISNSNSNKPANLPAGITIIITTSDSSPIYLENGTSGHIMFKIEKNGVGTFVEPKYYYRPISTNQMLLNPNLKQLFGWDL